MAEEPDYRMYLNERFDHLTHLVNAQFSAVNDRLDKIETQTTKTNDRVTELEKHKENCEGQKTGSDRQLSTWLKIGAFVISLTMALIAYANMTTRSAVEVLDRKVEWATSPFNERGLVLKDTLK